MTKLTQARIWLLILLILLAVPWQFAAAGPLLTSLAQLSGEPSYGPVTFSTDFDAENNTTINPGTRFDTDTVRLYASLPYENVNIGTPHKGLWYLDGEAFTQREGAFQLSEGTIENHIATTDGLPLPEGTYRFAFEVDGEPVLSADCVVGDVLWSGSTGFFSEELPSFGPMQFTTEFDAKSMRPIGSTPAFQIGVAQFYAYAEFRGASPGTPVTAHSYYSAPFVDREVPFYTNAGVLDQTDGIWWEQISYKKDGQLLPGSYHVTFEVNGQVVAAGETVVTAGTGATTGTSGGATSQPTETKEPVVPTPPATGPPQSSPTPQAGTVAPEPTPTPGTGPVNLASEENGGRIAYVSDQLDHYPAENLTDGYKLDFGEWWSHEDFEFPITIVFDLAGDESHVINHVVLNPWTSEWRYGWVEDFDIYVSDTSPNLEDMVLVDSYVLEHYGVDQAFEFDPARAKYVALVINSHSGSDEGVTLNEFEVYAAPPGAVPVEPIAQSNPDNLAAASNGGRIVHYSTEDDSGDWPVDLLIDGRNDTSEGWSSVSTEFPQYVVFAFHGDQRRVVDQVMLNPYSGNYEEDWVQDFELRGSETEPGISDMTSLGTFHLQQIGRDQTFTFEPAGLRYIALVPLSNYGGTAFGLNEFEVYAADGLASPVVTTHDDTRTLEERAPAGDEPVPQRPDTDVGPVLTPVSARSEVVQGGVTIDNIEIEEVAYNAIVPMIYHLYGPYFDDLAAATLANHNDMPVSVRVEASVPSYTEIAVETHVIQPGETIKVTLNPPLSPDAFTLLNEKRDATLHLLIEYLKEGERRLISEDTFPILIYASRDFPWGIPGFHAGVPFLAAMVTPNDPAVLDLLRVAADYHPSGIIVSGYDDETDSEWKVYNRMKAIYDAVADYYNVIYVSGGKAMWPHDETTEGFFLQRIKLPRDVLESHAGMCVETSLLFASAYEAIGLRTVLVHVPGHTYLAVPISEESTTSYILETTLVGRASFDDAVRRGAEEFAEAKSYLHADRLDEYYWEDVKEARVESILPMPWR